MLFFILTAGLLFFNAVIVDYLEGYKVLIKGQPISIVKDKMDITNRLAVLQRKIETEKGIEIVFDLNLLSFEKTEAKLDQFSSVAAIDQSLINNLTYRCKVWALKVNGQEKVFLRTKKEIEELIKRVVNYYLPKIRTDEKIENLTTRIIEEIEICEGLAYFDSIANLDEAFAYIIRGVKEQRFYAIEAGDTLYSISRKFNVAYAELLEANTGLNPTTLKIGQQISLTVPRPLINVEVSYRHIYDQIIFPPVITMLDNSMIRTRIVVDAEGEQGKKRIYADKVFINNREEKVSIIKEDILKQPKVRILRIGTLRTPDDILVAQSFLPPGLGVISDFFGSPRSGGRRHLGIDIAVAENTPVFAWKAGVVKTAGWGSGGYGYLVVIEHNEHLQSYYAHNNSVLVKPGQYVEKGEMIALSGNTGLSTGAHVHFEIRIDNKPVDPLWYLKTQP